MRGASAPCANSPPLGRVVAKAFVVSFQFFSTLALIAGLIVANLVRPGAGLNIHPAALDAAKVANYSSKAHESTLSGFLMDAIPNTFISALAQEYILHVLLVAILFGVALASLGERGARMRAPRGLTKYAGREVAQIRPRHETMNSKESFSPIRFYCASPRWPATDACVR